MLTAYSQKAEMDTTEARTSQDERGPPGESVYDGFISYSHAADDLLAPRLQAGLQRFAKPWWKRRALRMFRDESSLSANPHLWSSITDALDQSGWFVLLLSPDAAESVWVNQEVEYWLEHKDSDRIIPVVTDGEFTWSESDIDLESTAVPPALYGAFSDEPRWVDLRFARSEEQLDLGNPRFSAAVADIASAIRQVPKDELESEEVRQHRRTIRTAWAAAAGFLILALLAGGAALFALDQQAEANEQRQIAEENAGEAARQRDQAEQNAADAEEAAAAESEARQEAEQTALLEQSKSLALEAQLNLDIDPELSIWLAMSAVAKAREAGEESPVAVTSLHASVQSSRIDQRLSGGVFVSAAPDADLIVTKLDQAIVVVDVASGEVVSELATESDPLEDRATFGADGLVVVEMDGKTLLWRPATDTLAEAAAPPEGLAPSIHEISPDGSVVARIVSPADATSAEEDHPFRTLQLLSATSGELITTVQPGILAYDFASDGKTIAGLTTDNQGIVIVDVGSGELVRSIEIEPLGPGNPEVALSPQDDRLVVIAATVRMYDIESGARLWEVDVGRSNAIAWMADGSRFAVGSDSGVVRVFDPGTGEVIEELRGHGPFAFSIDTLRDGNRVISSDDNTLLVWDLSKPGGEEVSVIDHGVPAALGVLVTRDGQIVVTSSFGSGSSEPITVLLDSATGDHVREVVVPRGTFGLNEDGSLAGALNPDGTYSITSMVDGSVMYTAPAGWTMDGIAWDGSLVVIHDATGELSSRVVDITTGTTLLELKPGLNSSGRFNRDGSLLSTFGPGIYRIEGGDEIGGGADEDTVYRFFSPDGTMLAITTWFGEVRIYDTAPLLAGHPLTDALLREFRTHKGQAIFGAWSEDSTMIAIAAVGGLVRVFDPGTGDLLQEFDSRYVADNQWVAFHPTDPHIYTKGPDNTVRVYTHDVDELMAIAAERLTRSLTSDECMTYGIDPCPTLEEIRTGSA
jgi:WD40 repeat protein